MDVWNAVYAYGSQYSVLELRLLYVAAGSAGAGHCRHPDRNQWFDRTAFAVPGLYQFGNAGRNILRGPSFGPRIGPYRNRCDSRRRYG
jgi:hypothetical protein